MRVLITGATGLVGRKLCNRLFREGHELVVLSRNPEKMAPRLGVPALFLPWNPSQPVDLRGAEKDGATVDAVVHLAGESVAGGRWTAERKKRIHDSRVEGTQNLLAGLSKLNKKPAVIVSASAVGFYGDRGKEELTETSGPGEDFLATVCRSWEAALFDPRVLAAESVRRVAIRIGVVLSSTEGALERMVPVFRMGLGGPVGSGRQYMSWIQIDDLVSLFVTALQDARYTGVVNGVAPGPVTNREFSKVLATVLEKPCLLKAPALGLKLGLGEMSTIVLGGARVLPARAQELGFQFQYPELEGALRSVVRADSEIFEAYQWIPKPVEEVFPFFSEAKNLEKITPEWLNFNIVRVSTPSIQKGTLIDYRLKLHGVPMKWRTLIEVWKPNQEFVDTQLSGPYALWHHTHRFAPLRGGTWMEDRVLYRLPMGLLGRAVASGKVASDVSKIFAYRHQVITRVFGRLDSVPPSSAP